MSRRKRDYSDVGSLAKYLRLYHGYSRRRLAEACGLSQGQIFDYEHGRRGCPWETSSSWRHSLP